MFQYFAVTHRHYYCFTTNGERNKRGCKCQNKKKSAVQRIILQGKGVHREVESEGSRMANLWSDEQKSHIRLGISGKVATQTEAQ